jgi:hypothetical protein
MQFTGTMDLQALAELNGINVDEGDLTGISSRAIDSDGDGRPDLYLVDLDSDGSIDGIVRGFDSNGDGVNDTFIQYNEDGSVQSIGKVDPVTGELDVVYEEPDALDALLDSLGLIDLQSPEEALFTSFEDPYILQTYGSFGEEVPEIAYEPDVVDDFTIVDIDAEDAAATDASSSSEELGEAADEEPIENPPEASATIVEIEDRSGGEGSSLWAEVDKDADGIADYDVRIEKTSTGTYYGDIDENGYSEDVASDVDMDGRMDTVDTTGKGSSTDTVGAEQIVEPGSDYLVDSSPGESEFSESDAGVGISPEPSPDAGTSDYGDIGSESVDDGYDGGASMDMGEDPV